MKNKHLRIRIETLVAVLTTTFLPLTFTSPAFGQGAWTTKTPMLQEAFGGAAGGVSYGGQFYVMGFVLGGSILPPQVYDPATDTWSNKAADPVPSAEVAAGAINNKIYVAEGWINSDSNNASNALEIYDPAADTWSVGAPSLVARGTSASAVIGGKLYITGGSAYWQSATIATLEIYDPSTNMWSTGAPVPAAFDTSVGAAINGKFYVVGGLAAGWGLATANLYIYDPATNVWTTGAPMPAPRALAVGGVINDRLYITGGWTTVGADNPVAIYTPATDTWSTGTPDPNPHAFGAAAVVNGTLYVAGGFSNGVYGGAYAPDLEAFMPAPAFSAQVQQPINADGMSVFSVRRGVVPVKFTLTQSGIATCTLLPATIALTRTSGGTMGTVDESVYSGSADNGSNFRVDSCQYVYNLSASALGVGTYRVDIKSNGAVIGSGIFALK